MNTKVKKKIRCHFVDFWSKDLSDIHWFDIIIAPYYDIVWDDKNPDYLFYSCFGQEHLNYPECVKIFYSNENIEPDFNFCDYAISLSPIIIGDRALRLYNINIYLDKEIIPDNLLERKFCNFVYSNSSLADPFREKLFHRLSEYKKVDAGGHLLNNIGAPVEDKQAFLSQYKFTLAIENSSLPGYSTEKIVHPFLSHSLPLYWGNPDTGKDYNPDAFVNLMEFDSIDKAIEEIIRLDHDDEAYLKKLNAPFWPYGDDLEDFKMKEMEKNRKFIQHIFDQPLDQARRRTLYGWNRIVTYQRNQPVSLTRRILNVGKKMVRSVIK